MSIDETELPSNEPCDSGQEGALPEVPEAFSVHDDGSANWLIRRINECRAYAQRCDEWAARERRRAARDEEFFWFRYGAQLRDYVQHRLADKGRRKKSLSLPAGTAGFRKEAAKIVVDDEVVVLAWAKAHEPALVTVVEKLSKSALNAHVEATGELPEAGVHVEPEHEKFYVK